MITKEDSAIIITTSTEDNFDYKATHEGDMWYREHARHGYPDPAPIWKPLFPIANREWVWTHLRMHYNRILWREENGKDIEIPGFDHRDDWFICQTCGSYYTDLPSTVRRLRHEGCTYNDCTNRH